MKVFTSLDEWKRARPGLTGSLGLVPTMGWAKTLGVSFGSLAHHNEVILRLGEPQAAGGG